jgi:hypothetical protein
MLAEARAKANMNQGYSEAGNVRVPPPRLGQQATATDTVAATAGGTGAYMGPASGCCSTSASTWGFALTALATAATMATAPIATTTVGDGDMAVAKGAGMSRHFGALVLAAIVLALGSHVFGVNVEPSQMSSLSAMATNGQDTDVLHDCWDWFAAKTAAMSSGMFWAIFRCACFLIAATILTGLSFSHARQSAPRAALLPLHWVICLFILFCVVQIRLNEITLSQAAKRMILLTSLCACIVLPPRLAWFLAPQEIQRLRVCLGIFGVLLLVIAIQFFR